jgi:hypothetical protein
MQVPRCRWVVRITIERFFGELMPVAEAPFLGPATASNRSILVEHEVLDTFLLS